MENHEKIKVNVKPGGRGMRLRHIPGAEQMIEDSPYVIQNPEERKGKWHEVFGNHNPIRIEVGMGEGQVYHGTGQSQP